jgi:hypothetical protein
VLFRSIDAFSPTGVGEDQASLQHLLLNLLGAKRDLPDVRVRKAIKYLGTVRQKPMQARKAAARIPLAVQSNRSWPDCVSPAPIVRARRLSLAPMMAQVENE